MQTDLEAKLAHAHEALKEKETIEISHKDSLKNLSHTVDLLKQENERLKREIQSIEDVKTAIRQEDLAASKSREG
jgi:predicted RNase H-like nuclease (RuvC/YqgF family)